MSTAQNTNGPSRKSFAQVAAAAHKPAVSRVDSPTTNESKSKLHHISPASAQNVTISNAELISCAKESSQPSSHAAENAQLSGMMKAIGLEDKPADSPALSATFKRKDNSDTKSVASRTTLNLDEKESLRPDDSASVQAAADEEEISPNESATAPSKLGYDTDTRAFRDQLYEIDRTETTRLLAQRTPQPEVLAPPPRNGSIIYVASNGPIAPPGNGNLVHPAVGGVPGTFVFPPDEKLQEALASPKDRLFVLKIEQDFIDLIKDSQESELQLPQTNAFYRMLSHKLAEYYFLGHVVDESLSAVRIYKLPQSRLPPPLIRSEPKSESATPPPHGSAPKIMRRGVPNGQTSGREGASGGPPPLSRGQETGTTSGSEEDGKGKNLTREEREKQYADVRARIFDGFAEAKAKGEAVEGGSGSNSKGISRSSSNSGQKKNRKPKKPKDDTFEARSAYSQYPGQPFVNIGFPQLQGNASVYNGYPGFAHPVSPGFQPGPQVFSAGAASMSQQSMNSPNLWSGHTFSPQFGGTPELGAMPAFNPAQYDPTSGSFQPYGSPSKSTPKPHQPSLATYYQGQMPDADTIGWPQQPYDSGYMPQNGMGATNGAFATPYGYQQMDANGYNSAFNMYNVPTFNPQSQSFVPTAVPGGNWSQMPQQMQHQQSMPPPGYPPSSYSAPNIFDSNSHGTSSRSASHGNSPAPRQKSSSSRPAQPAPNKDSITKWATPSSLPAKPPPPTSSLSFSAPRYSETQQPLPSHPFAATNGR